jgi:hypothetical protein
VAAALAIWRVYEEEFRESGGLSSSWDRTFAAEGVIGGAKL